MDVSSGHGVWAVEVDCLGIIFSEQIPKMGERVLRAEHSPDSVAVEGVVAVELMSLHPGKLGDKLWSNLKLLLAVLARRLVFVDADARLQKLRHLQERTDKNRRQSCEPHKLLAVE